MGKREYTVETLSFINHTECHCIERRNESASSNRLNINTTNLMETESSAANMSTTSSTNRTRCNCVKHFSEIFVRDDTDTENTENGNVNDSDADERVDRCRCDCTDDNVKCEWLKKGKEGFPIEDRR